jgi:hypothetical protein
MKIFNIKALKAELAQGDLRAPETAKYLAAQAVLVSIIFIPSPGHRAVDWAFVANPLVSLLGLYYCYRQNGGETGLRFAERYLALGWVVGWRVGVVMVVLTPLSLGALLFATGNVAWLGEQRLADVFAASILAMIAFMYWRIGRHLGDLATARG